MVPCPRWRRVLDGKIEGAKLDVEIRLDRLVLDQLPDDPRHLIPVEIDDGVLHHDLVQWKSPAGFEGVLLSVCGRHCGLLAPIASCSDDGSKGRGHEKREKKTRAMPKSRATPDPRASRRRSFWSNRSLARISALPRAPWPISVSPSFASSLLATAGRAIERAPPLPAPTPSSTTATVYPSLEQAVADLNFLLATTARPRGMVKPVPTLEGAARELAARGGKGSASASCRPGAQRSRQRRDLARRRNRHRSGQPAFASLSLPQTVLLVAYDGSVRKRRSRRLAAPRHTMDRRRKGSTLPARASPPGPSCWAFRAPRSRA